MRFFLKDGSEADVMVPIKESRSDITSRFRRMQKMNPSLPVHLAGDRIILISQLSLNEVLVYDTKKRVVHIAIGDDETPLQAWNRILEIVSNAMTNRIPAFVPTAGGGEISVMDIQLDNALFERLNGIMSKHRHMPTHLIIEPWKKGRDGYKKKD